MKKSGDNNSKEHQCQLPTSQNYYLLAVASDSFNKISLPVSISMQQLMHQCKDVAYKQNKQYSVTTANDILQFPVHLSTGHSHSSAHVCCKACKNQGACKADEEEGEYLGVLESAVLLIAHMVHGWDIQALLLEWFDQPHTEEDEMLKWRRSKADTEFEQGGRLWVLILLWSVQTDTGQSVLLRPVCMLLLVMNVKVVSRVQLVLCAIFGFHQSAVCFSFLLQIGTKWHHPVHHC